MVRSLPVHVQRWHQERLHPGRVRRAPRIDLVALAPGAWQRAILPPQCLHGGVTLVDGEEMVDRREHRHRCVSPVVLRADQKRGGEAHLWRTVVRCYKLREMERSEGALVEVGIEVRQ